MKILKILGGIVVLGLLVWLILFIAKMAILLLPLVLIVLGGYFGYKYLKTKFMS